MGDFNRIADLFPDLMQHFTKESLGEFIACSRDDLCYCHMGLGMWIRNELLSEWGDLYKWFQERGVYARDDMSHLIIEQFHEFLRSRTYCGISDKK